MKLSGTILFSIVALQQVMNYAVQAAPKACSENALKACNSFKIEGETCTCAAVQDFFFPAGCEIRGANLKDPKDKKCGLKTKALKLCSAFCQTDGSSCSANGCIPY